MDILKKFTPTLEKQVEALEMRAQRESVFLAYDLWQSVDQIKTELIATPKIPDIDQFKQRVRSNVNFGWKELKPEERGYYYPLFPFFEANTEQVDNYWERLWNLATDNLVKTFSDYVEAQSSAENKL